MSPARRHGLALLAVVLAAWAMRLALALRGGVLYFPDEWRYFTGILVADALVEGRPGDAARILVGAGGHSGFAVASLPAVVLQGVARVATGRPPEQTLPIALAWFTLVSALVPAALHALARRWGASPAHALAAAALCAVPVCLARYSRHLFPYDASLLAILLGWWLAEDPSRRASRLLAGGAVISLGVWIYNGYWAPALAACALSALRLLSSRAPLAARAGRVALVAAGTLLPVLLILIVSRLTGAGAADKLVAHSRSLIGGTPAEGWWIPWAFFWHSEGPLLPLLLGAGLLAAIRARGAALRALAAAGLVYALLALASSGLGLWPVFGRLARVLMPFLCLAAAGLVLRAACPPRAALAAAALAAGLAAWNLRVPFAERFPTDVLPELLKTHPGEISVFAQNTGQMLPLAEPELLRPDAPLVFTNPRVPKPVRGFIPAPAGKLLWAHPHPSQHPSNHYDGYLAHERELLRAEDFRMKLIDTRLPP